MFDVIPLEAFSDNYIWLIRPHHQTHVYVVDPGDASVVINYLEQARLTLAGILITHHHADHTGGIATLSAYAKNDICIFGPASENITGVTHPISDESDIPLPQLGLTAQVIHTPGHTLGHICYVIANVVFCGDTLFSAGCGRIFEGTAEQMFSSLNRLANLPKDTLVYCTHEYTLSNLAFANKVNPNDLALQQYTQWAEARRAENLPTLPSTIANELAINPFLRADMSTIQSSISQHFQHYPNKNVEYFALLREWKDKS